jgi:hypothetical protein
LHRVNTNLGYSHASYKKEQEDVLRAASMGDVLGIMPTGKSW